MIVYLERESLARCRLVRVNYPGRRVASRGNVTPLFDVVSPVFVSHSGSHGNCLRRACRNERVARLEASPARSPMMQCCSHMGRRACGFEQPAQDHLFGALSTPFLDATLQRSQLRLAGIRLWKLLC